jgi:hypothetical protein
VTCETGNIVAHAFAAIEKQLKTSLHCNLVGEIAKETGVILRSTIIEMVPVNV